MKKKIRVMVLMGGKSPEHEVSLVTGRSTVKHLNTNKYEVLPVVISKDGVSWQLKNKDQFLAVDQTVASTNDSLPNKEILSLDSLKQKTDLVFLAMHGPYGEGGAIQGILQTLGIAFTGAGVLASALGMDKIMFKKIMQADKIATPRGIVLTPKDDPEIIWKIFNLPIIIKPFNQGSSVGVSLVKNKKDLTKALNLVFKYGSYALVEEFLFGTEISCGVLGNEDLFVLPVAEIIPKNDFFDYEAKYFEGKSQEIIPARISKQLTQKVQEIAKKVYQAIGCCGFARIDMIIVKNQPFVLEINTIPGLTPVSILPKEAAAAGISYSDLIEKIINLALEKNERNLS